jgi:(4S)-4-hydroxy-5-phosphonooxypentane-2,3-dione isomerase
MYVITVLFTIQPAHYAEFLQAIIANAQTSLFKESGCWQFDVCSSSSKSNDIFLYEVYETKEAFDLHLTSEHFLAFNAHTSAWVTAKAVTTFDRVFSNLNHK